MKPRISVLCTFVASVLLAGCGEDAIAPDTTPPLAPVIQGATLESSVVGIWWAPNTEPDLAGYNIYFSQNGSTWLATQQPLVDTFIGLMVDDPVEPLYVYVTAVDVSENESGPSGTARAIRILPTHPERHQDNQPYESTIE